MHSAHALAAADVLVTSLRGDARVGNAAVKQLDQLPYQQRIELADGAQLVLVDLRSAQQYVVRGPGQYVLEPDGVQPRAGAAVQRKQLPAAYRGIGLDEGKTTHAGATLRAADPADSSDWPAFAADQQEERIATRNARLRWPAQPHKGGWQLRINELDGTPVYQTTVTPNQALLPDTVALAPEHDYRRVLEWRAPGGMVQSSSVVLRTLSDAQTRQLDALAPVADTSPPERLLYALWLRSLGVRSLAQDHACLLHEENC
ncbi:hypothetical protein [Duganella levis]|uniref:DUF4968 domain-containing protein n=1 Tax=Duganella levis TaxID=2692169 RepID=A0ABW9VZ30_9BURK|nr:hypothetical protein [Duganella levis]MYN26932.1 hypothetical protein [Duganella levis]